MKKTLAIGGVLLLLIGLYVFPYDSNSKESQPQIEFKTTEVLQGPLTVRISATGVVEPNFQVEVKSKASGEVLEFPYEEGDRVKEGAPLLKLDKSDELRAVARAQADQMSAVANLKKAEISLLLQKTKFETDLRTAQSSVEEAQANLQESEEKLQRQRDLFAQKFASEETLDAAETTFLVNKEKLVQAEAQLQKAKNAVHDIAIKESEIVLARSEVERTDIALDEAQERLEETEIFAPITGVIIKKLVEKGQIISSGISNVSGGTPLATIADMSRLFILADIDETDIGSIQIGQKVEVTTDAFLGKVFQGRVVRLAPQGEVESNITIFKAKIEILGKGKNILKPMMTANVDIVTARVENTLYLAREGVRSKEDGSSYAVVLFNGAPEEIPVETGIQNPIHVQIVSGLELNQKVVIGDWEKLLEASDSKKKGSTLRKILWMIRSK